MRNNSLKKSVISGVLVLAVSISMLLGVTYAVFNDSASTTVNTIQAGTLDVDLVDGNGATLVGQTVDFAGDGNIYWEPDRGHELNPVYIKNNGNLDLVYKIVVNGIDGSDDLGRSITWSVKVGDDTVDLANYEATLAVGATSDPVVLVGTMAHETLNDVMGDSIEGISITVLAKQTTEQAEYPQA